MSNVVHRRAPEPTLNRTEGDAADPVEALRAVTEGILRRLLPPPTEIALVDFPAHANAGDSLIYVGEERYLRNLGYRVRYLADPATYHPSRLRRRLPSGPIFIRGGGNLGDRWLHSQQFRERVLVEFPDRPVVQLPQSMDFSDPANQRQAHQVFRAHPNLVLLLRDGRSLDRARRAFPGVRCEFCPDLALGAGWLDRPRPPDHDAVLLMREDEERTGRHDLAFPARVTTLRRDWGFTGTAWLRWNAARVAPALVARLPAVAWPAAVDGSLRLMARTAVATAMGVLARGRVVVTDRLHAAVLAALMRIPVVVLDNTYGKISAAHNDYLHMIPGLRFAATDREAVDVALACLADQQRGG